MDLDCQLEGDCLFGQCIQSCIQERLTHITFTPYIHPHSLQILSFKDFDMCSTFTNMTAELPDKDQA